jgi:cytochrome P450
MTTHPELLLADLDTFNSGPPWELFDDLRTNDPCRWDAEEAPNHGFWSITRYHDIVKILRDPETFSSEVGTANLEELDQEQMDARRSMLECKTISPPRRCWDMRPSYVV